MADAHVTTKNILITQQRAMLTEVSYGSLFIYYGSYLTKLVPLTICAWVRAAALRPVSFRPVNLNETKGANYERQRKI